MPTPVTLENEFLRATVWPGMGGKVSSIVDRADEFELLFQYDVPKPPVPQYDTSFERWWYAGWDECFPGVAAGPYPGGPWDGTRVPDHGELYGLPTVSDADARSVATTWHGVRFPYRLKRTLALDGPALVARYHLDNCAPFPFHFVWAMHSLSSLARPVQIDLPAGTPMRLSHDAAGNRIDQQVRWPAGPGGLDLSRPDRLPPGRGWKLFTDEPAWDELDLRYADRGRRVHLGYASDSAVVPYWGIWINTGGWAGHRHFAVEPTTGRYDQLDRSVADGSATTVGPMGTVNWTVKWEVAGL